MKLNLLPTHVSKGSQLRTGVIIGIVLFLLGFGTMYYLMSSSQKQRNDSMTAAENLRADAAQAVSIASDADRIITNAAGLQLNIALARQMDLHNQVYPDFYDKFFPFIPGFFRINSMRAVPNGGDSCVVTMGGVIHTFQDYADVMLAMLRVPGAQSVTRSGYVLEETVIPPLNAQDQKGIPIRPGEPRLPEDKRDRLDALIATGGVEGVNNQGGFGTPGVPRVREAMPHWSNITIAVVVTANLQTPDPMATLLANAPIYGAVPRPRAPEALAGIAVVTPPVQKPVIVTPAPAPVLKKANGVQRAGGI